MKLDVTCMRYLTKDDYRVLTAVEMGMRNHEMVPVSLITSIAKLRFGGSYKILSTLLRYKLLAHTNQEYDGYRLSYMGYDILALRTLLSRKVIASVGRRIGVGKESDIFEAKDEAFTFMAFFEDKSSKPIIIFQAPVADEDHDFLLETDHENPNAIFKMTVSDEDDNTILEGWDFDGDFTMDYAI